MPCYRYRCGDGHEFEQRGGFEDAVVPCSVAGCGRSALRQAVYRDQAVVFVGPGWTKSVLTPSAPAPPSSAGESTDVHFERLDQFAEEQYRYDKEIRPLVKEARRKEAEDG